MLAHSSRVDSSRLLERTRPLHGGRVVLVPYVELSLVFE